ncbi:Uncharacterised protein g157 [Pycnogonum litorale]
MATISNQGKILDHTQYTRRSVLRYEWMYGKGGLSNGGPSITAEVSKLLNLKPNDRVLDVGCGIAGPAIHMTQVYGCKVHGLDFSHNMMEIANERLRDSGLDSDDRVMIILSECDLFEASLEPASYDVVHCRDTMVHTPEKSKWLNKFMEVLKPGGRLLVTDYCRGDQINSQEYLDYIDQRGYNVLAVSDYHQVLCEAGFVNVKSESRTEQYGRILASELDKLERHRDCFVSQFSEKEYRYMMELWRSKLMKNKDGDHTWGILYGEKKY